MSSINKAKQAVEAAQKQLEDALDFLANKSVTSGFMTVSEPSKLTLEYWEGVSICHVSQIENIVFFLRKKGDK